MSDRVTWAFGIAFSVTALFSAILVVFKELNPDILQWMTEVTGHHWATHSALDMVMFLALGLVLLLGVPGTVRRLTLFVVGATILSSTIIAGFFLLK